MNMGEYTRNPICSQRKRSATLKQHSLRQTGDNEMRTTVLCVGRNEKDLAVRKFLLETRGYRVQLASAEREVLIGSQQGCYKDVKLLLCGDAEFSEASLQRMQAAVLCAKLVALEREESSPVIFLERMPLEMLRLRTAA